MVYAPERWGEAAAAAKKERHPPRARPGRRLLAHNFTHHFEIPDDSSRAWPPPASGALGALHPAAWTRSALSSTGPRQPCPAAERGRRLPSSDEIAQALVLHERTSGADPVGALRLRRRVPASAHRRVRHWPRRPPATRNLWAGDATESPGEGAGAADARLRGPDALPSAPTVALYKAQSCGHWSH